MTPSYIAGMGFAVYVDPLLPYVDFCIQDPDLVSNRGFPILFIRSMGHLKLSHGEIIYMDPDLSEVYRAGVIHMFLHQVQDAKSYMP